MYQCYYQPDPRDIETRCKNEQEDYWCSPEHDRLWHEMSYIDKRDRQKRQLSIQEMQKQLKQMAIDAKRKRLTEQSGQQKIL